MFHINKKSFSSLIPRIPKKMKGFTLIELLIVIAILAILATVTLLVINPAQMIKQSRDSNRIADLNQLNKGLLLYQTLSSNISMGTHGTVYVSLPGAQPDCSDLGLPALGGGYVYACSTSANYRKMDGTGWVPVNFTSIQDQAGSIFTSLPIDPNNTVTDGYYYTYIPGSWALSATMESTKYSELNATTDGGQSTTRFEIGNELTLNENLGWVCGDTLVDSRDSQEYATVEIGTQCWMASNIMASKYPDGSDIARGPVGATWSSTDLGYYAYPPNTSNNAEETLENIISGNLGFVYQWSAAMHGSSSGSGVQGICPTGWHIPTDAEWKILVESQAAVGCESATGWQCSSAGSHLSNYTSGHDNSSGFSGLLVGYRTPSGSFSDRTVGTDIWSSIESSSNAWLRSLYYTQTGVYRNPHSKAYGFSVRCLKN